jgi:hypothetical protein
VCSKKFAILAIARQSVVIWESVCSTWPAHIIDAKISQSVTFFIGYCALHWLWVGKAGTGRTLRKSRVVYAGETGILRPAIPADRSQPARIRADLRVATASSASKHRERASSAPAAKSEALRGNYFRQLGQQAGRAPEGARSGNIALLRRHRGCCFFVRRTRSFEHFYIYRACR